MKRVALLSLLLARVALAAITVDANFPVTAKEIGTGGATLTTATWTTAGTNRMMVAALGCDSTAKVFSTNGTNHDDGVTVSGAGLTWTKQVTSVFSTGSFPDQQGVHVWTAPAAATLTNQTATLTRQNGATEATCILTIYALAGAYTAGVGNHGTRIDAACNTSLAINAVVNASVAGSFIVGSWLDGNQAITLVADANSTLASTINDTTNGSGFATGNRTSTTSGAGNVTVGTTTTDHCATTAVLEICPASGCSSGTVPMRSLMGVGT